MAEAKREMAQDMEGFMEGSRPLPEGVAGSMHVDQKPTGGSDNLSLNYVCLMDCFANIAVLSQNVHKSGKTVKNLLEQYASSADIIFIQEATFPLI